MPLEEYNNTGGIHLKSIYSTQAPELKRRIIDAMKLPNKTCLSQLQPAMYFPASYWKQQVTFLIKFRLPFFQLDFTINSKRRVKNRLSDI